MLRFFAVLHALAVLAQAIFAGQFLSGVDSSVVLHEKIGLAAVGLSLGLVVISAVGKLPRSSFVPFLLASILILLGEALQVGSGYGRFLEVHVPLGVLTFGGAAVQVLLVLRAE